MSRNPDLQRIRISQRARGLLLMAAMLSNLPSPAVSERSPGIPLLAKPLHFDVVVYHAGPAGIAAAAAAASSGCSVLLADPAPLAATAPTD